MVSSVPKVIRDIRQLTGPQRAAVLVMHLDPKVAKRLLGQLSTGEIKQIQATIASLDEVDPTVVQAVVQEFLDDIAPSPTPAAARAPRAERGSVPVDHEFAILVSEESAHRVADVLEAMDPPAAALALHLMGQENAQRALYVMPTTVRRLLTMSMSEVRRIDTGAAARAIGDVTHALESHREHARRNVRREREPAHSPVVASRLDVETFVRQPTVKSGVEALMRTGDETAAAKAVAAVAQPVATTEPAPVAASVEPRESRSAYDVFSESVPRYTGPVVRPDPIGRATPVPGVLELIRKARGSILSAVAEQYADLTEQVDFFVRTLPYTASPVARRAAKVVPQVPRAQVRRVARVERRRAESHARAARALPAMNPAAVLGDDAVSRPAVAELTETIARAESEILDRAAGVKGLSPIALLAMQVKAGNPRADRAPALSLFAPTGSRNRPV